MADLISKEHIVFGIDWGIGKSKTAVCQFLNRDGRLLFVDSAMISFDPKEQEKQLREYVARVVKSNG